jgi:lysophospholipase L1-like esterase
MIAPASNQATGKGTNMKGYQYFWTIAATALLMTAGASAQEDRWEKNIAAFEAADAKEAPEKGGTVFIGSSSIVMWNTSASFPDYVTTNRGFGGSEVADSLRYADRILIPYEPKLVFLYAGDNDISRGKTPQQVFTDYKAFAALVHEALPKTEIQFVAIKPSLARWHLVKPMREANALIREFSKRYTYLGYVDVDAPMLGEDGKPRKELFVDDGLHMSQEGYAIWNKLMEPILKANEGSETKEKAEK